MVQELQWNTQIGNLDDIFILSLSLSLSHISLYQHDIQWNFFFFFLKKILIPGTEFVVCMFKETQAQENQIFNFIDCGTKY